jgi:uncharacterized membrane protein
LLPGWSESAKWPQGFQEVDPVDPVQTLFGVALVVVLVTLAGYFGWRQVQALRSLRQPGDLSPEDRRYVYNQAARRLVGSALMLALAVLLASAFFLEGPANMLLAEREAAIERGEQPRLDASQRDFWNTYRIHWLIILLILFVIIILAGWDYFAIRRFGLRHYRQIQEGRRAMIENELARLRSQRNGHN